MIRPYYTSLDQSGATELLTSLQKREEYDEEDLLAYATICRRGYDQRVNRKHILDCFGRSTQFHELYLCYCSSTKVTTPALVSAIRMIGEERVRTQLSQLRRQYAVYLDDVDFLSNDDLNNEALVKLVRSHSTRCLQKWYQEFMNDTKSRKFYYETLFKYSFNLLTKNDMNKEVFSVIAKGIGSLDELDIAYLTSLLDELESIDIDPEDYRRLAIYFPKQLNNELVDFSPLSRKILSIENDVLRAYLLGFDVSETIPSKKMLFDAAKELDQLGIDQFCQNICKHAECINPQEPIGLNSVSSFHPFDRVLINQDSLIYCITRNMFSLVLSNGLNPYTRVEIHPVFKMKIEMKANIELRYKLPPSIPFDEILKSF